MKRLLLATLILLVCLVSAAGVQAAGIIRYVDGSVPASGAGTSWAVAFKTIQESITAATNGDEVWVKQGTYPLTSTISLTKQVKIYGGFAGTETERGQRNWVTRPTILDGQNGGPSHNYGCVYINAGAAALDGFRITNGNYASGVGGGIRTGSCYLDNTFANATQIANCAIYSNYAGSGGGLALNNYVGIISNCLVLYNNADSGGGIFLYNAAYPAIVNSTVYGNHSDSEGGGMYHVQDSFTKVINSIIWGNTAVTSAPQIYKYGGSSSYTYCDVQGGWSGTGNKNADPLFANPATGDFHLKNGSPCIDAGNNNPTHFFTFNVLPATDYDKGPRVVDGNRDQNAKVDMGAYEYNPAKVFIPGLFILMGD